MIVDGGHDKKSQLCCQAPEVLSSAIHHYHRSSQLRHRFVYPDQRAFRMQGIE
jgi:hypothetical protein